ncbi:MAG: hypothetical protein H0W30_09845 [Gemmatimonadaceae bacterium]|nr:hypothetical protein [Gemmatimonadaceae bacterium]
MPATTLESMTRPTSDATARLGALAETLRTAALTVLWRQWRAVGGQTATRGAAQAIVDPEALVLQSLAMTENEPRLADILHDWTLLNSDLLSVQRLKNLAPAYTKETAERLAWLARVVTVEVKDLRWRSLCADDPVNRSAAGSDPEIRTNKRRAIRVRPEAPATLALRLRLGFGVGAKADVLTFLIGTSGDGATVREIAGATGYTVAAVRRAAEDMAAAALLHVTAEQPVKFRADSDAWGEVLGVAGEVPPWGHWQARFALWLPFSRGKRTRGPDQ